MPRKPTWLSRICTLLSLSLAISPPTKPPPASSSSENSETFLAATAKYPHFQLPSVDLRESLRTRGPPGRGSKPLGRVISRKNEQDCHGNVEKTDKENENQDTADNTQDYTLDKDTHDISSPFQLDSNSDIGPSSSEPFSEPSFTIAPPTFPNDSIITETLPIFIARRRIVRLVSIHRKSPSNKKDKDPLVLRSPLSMNPVLRHAEEMETEVTNETMEDKKINEKEEKKGSNEEQYKQQNQDKKSGIKYTPIKFDHLRPPPLPLEIKITVPPRSPRRLTAPPPPRTHPYSPLLSPLSSPLLTSTSPSLSSQPQSLSLSPSSSPTLTPACSKCSVITASKVSPATPPVPPPPFPFVSPTPAITSIPILIPSQPSTDRLPSLTSSASTATTKSSSSEPPPPQMPMSDSIREPRMPEEDIYASWGDYYFDERNFLHPMRQGRRGKMRTFPVRTIVR